MSSKTINILVIDDEEDFSYFVMRNLERLGYYNVTSATEGNKGLQMAKENKPDLILLDIMMPGITGFEVLEALKKDQNTKNIPVIMLTGVEDDEAKIKAANLKNEDYIAKPVELEELRSRIEKALP